VIVARQPPALPKYARTEQIGSETGISPEACSRVSWHLQAQRDRPSWRGGGGIGVDWPLVLAGVGEVPRGLSDTAIISSWLASSDKVAFPGIVTQVGAATTDELDRLDAALLSLATTSASPAARLRLTKFYAIFKIAEMQRYREFRGFPQ
jgi:hypothetical protein